MKKSEPNFLVIGGMRCATGWIRQCLKEHPDIFMPRKEIHFFEREYEKGLEYWLSFFEDRGDQKAVGEKTATYLHEKIVPERIAEHYPDMKLICCIRDPVERMFSHFMMNRNGDESLRDKKFEEVSTLDSEYFKRSLYFTHISNFMKHFPRENILLLVYEDKDKDQYGFLEKIFRFLEVDPNFRPPSAKIQMKQGSFEHGNNGWNIISTVMLHPRSPRFLKKAYSGLRPSAESEIEEKTYRRMGPLLASEIKGLEEILDRKLDCWRTRAYADF
ncbi:MAG: sulfotransferase domain-containing protein [Candidatus Bathyarchaeota archaeon]|nr:sulfotransferase domain-containing protein [Candidatus Bathyarchaeota archaeon]